jgi:hypothetical protein
VAEQRAWHKARFCLASGVQPSEYDQLTAFEVAAWLEAIEQRDRR